MAGVLWAFDDCYHDFRGKEIRSRGPDFLAPGKIDTKPEAPCSRELDACFDSLSSHASFSRKPLFRSG